MEKRKGEKDMERRTDLAVEERELLGEDIKGVSYQEEEIEGLPIERLRILTQRAGQLLKKPVGTYITAQLPPLTDSIRDTDSRVRALSDEIRHLLPVNGLVLVAGLGNVEITPDALGPKAASKVLATRHIRGEIARSTGLDRLRAVAVVNTGVTGQTGIETAPQATKQTSAIYNLNGQKVTNPKSGLYIINGRKVVIK